MSVLNFTHT